MKSKFLFSMMTAAFITACAPGTQSADSEARDLAGNILGGQLVRSNEILKKTTVMINLKSRETGAAVYCSGTVISERYVLTAAHCFENREVINVQSADGKKARALRFELHGLYNHSQEYDRYDIALVEFMPNENFKDFAVLSDQVPETDSIIHIAGFGRTNIEEESQKILNRINLKMAGSDFTPSEAIIHEDLTHGSCFGDSGGPAYYIKNGKVYVWGVDSRTPSAANARCGKFEIYTKIRPVIHWITASIQI